MAGLRSSVVTYPSKSLGGCKISKPLFASALLVLDAIFVALIIAFVPYTKIDWDAYMSQVDGFLGGERDYGKLKGDTGPLVYPAGFLYIYSAIKYLTSGEVFPAQLPWWALGLLCLSKRIHSIFMLRLFNDCFAMTLFHASLALLLYRKWHLGLIIFSCAVSVKMNVLLYAPPLFLLLLKALDIKDVFFALLGATLVQLNYLQIILGLPFLLSFPLEYISNAFNFGRVFIHFWSVNFKFVPEELFVSKKFASALLILHLLLLMLFANFKWSKNEGGNFHLLRSRLSDAFNSFQSVQQKSSELQLKILSEEHITTVMFAGNFIGIVCAHSLHCQFYSWLIIFAGVKLCWNIYPSNFYSSLLLLCRHLSILLGLWVASNERPYLDRQTLERKKN